MSGAFPKNLYVVWGGVGDEQFIDAHEKLGEIAEVGIEKTVAVYHLSTKLLVTADVNSVPVSAPVTSKAEVTRTKGMGDIGSEVER